MEFPRRDRRIDLIDPINTSAIAAFLDLLGNIHIYFVVET